MDVLLRRGDLVTRPAGAVAIGILAGTRELTGAARALDRASRGMISALLEGGDFTGRFLELAVLYPPRGGGRRVIVVGLGAVGDLTEHRVRQAAAQVARRARELGVKTLT